MSKLDVLFINPANRKAIYQSLASDLSAIEPPIWAGLMASFAQHAGLSVGILDLGAEELTPAEAARRVADLQPGLVVLVIYGQQPSASTQVMPGARVIAAHIKEIAEEIPILMTGGHVAALPERTLREEPVDFVATGEGLVTIVELAKSLKSGKIDKGAIPGLGYREGHDAHFNPSPGLVRDVDGTMAAMPWNLLPMERYRAHNWHCFGGKPRKPYAAIYTTLGCPYHCEFCCIQAPFREGERSLGMNASANSYRFWDPKLVLDQLGMLIETYGIVNVKIADEMFVLNEKHVTAICKGIVERGYKLNIWAYSRVDTVKERMLDLLKAAGVNWLALGIESADPAVRRAALKEFSQEKIIEVVRRIQSAGISVIGNYILGLPEDTLQTMQSTLDLALELRTEFANIYCAMAYPGSPLYDRAVRERWPLPGSWSGYSQHSKDSLPLPTKYLSGAEVVAFRDRAFQRYFTDSSYLEMLGKKFGEETVAEVKQMCSFKVERQSAPATAASCA